MRLVRRRRKGSAPRGWLLTAVGVAVSVVLAAQAAAGPPSAAISVEKHIPYVDGGSLNQTVDVYREDGTGQGAGGGRPAIILVHGGGFAGGSPDDLSAQARYAAQQGFVAFNLDYRTTSVLGTSGDAWPAEYEDVSAGVDWVYAHASEYGADPQKIAMLGSSAGGTLAARTAADQGTRVKALALWSSPTDLASLVPGPSGIPPACGGNNQCSTFWHGPWITNLLGCTPDWCPDRYADASPITHAEVMPSTFVANATAEIVPLGQATSMGEALRANDVTAKVEIVSGARHGHTFTDDVWNEMMPFLAAALDVPEPEPIDFGDSLFDVGWTMVAIVLAVVSVIVAVIMRIASDRDRGRAL